MSSVPGGLWQSLRGSGLHFWRPLVVQERLSLHPLPVPAGEDGSGVQAQILLWVLAPVGWAAP